MTCRKDETAILAMHATKPDVVILDLRLHQPGYGWEILWGMRRDSEVAGIPVVALTADTYTPRWIDELDRLGCDLRAKPIALDEFRTALQHLLGRNG